MPLRNIGFRKVPVTRNLRVLISHADGKCKIHIAANYQQYTLTLTAADFFHLVRAAPAIQREVIRAPVQVTQVTSSSSALS